MQFISQNVAQNGTPFLVATLLVVIISTTLLRGNDRLTGLKTFTGGLLCGSLCGVVWGMARVKKYRLPATGEQEYVCQCPRCLTLKTLWFRDGILVPTTRFSQREDGRVYHDCNGSSAGPCRLFPKWEVKV